MPQFSTRQVDSGTDHFIRARARSTQVKTCIKVVKRRQWLSRANLRSLVVTGLARKLLQHDTCHLRLPL